VPEGADAKVGLAVMSFRDKPSFANNCNSIKQWLKAASDPEEYARTLYANLRTLDQSGAGAILVEQPPWGLAWAAVRDRLWRARGPD